MSLTPAHRELLQRLLSAKGLAAPREHAIVARRRSSDADAADAPASVQQQRIWLLDQLQPGQATYNVPMAVRLTGDLHIAALERALTDIVRRHEVLRTAFVTDAGGRLRQRVLPASRVHLTPLDLTSLDREHREPEARRIADAEAREPFDLSHGSMMRARLLRLAADDHIILLTLHHIACDGWSMGVLLREVAALYGAFATGQQLPLREPAVQYADYAMWQEHWLQGDAMARELRYWRERLADAPPVLQLPMERPSRASAENARGARVTRRIDAQLTSNLREFGLREGATLFMTLLAAFQALLARYSGQDDICVGSPIANRTRVEIADLIGCFVNTIVLRTDLSGNPSFRDLLRRLRAVALEAYAHQDLPFERLVHELRPERALNRNPIVQVNFLLQNAPRPALALPGLALELLDIDNETAKFDLTLSVNEVDDALALAWIYNAELFDAESIARLAGHFETLLASVVRAPDEMLSGLRLITAGEEQQIRSWNETAVLFTDGAAAVHDLIARRAAERPDAVAVVCGEQRLTFAQLDARANGVARYLRNAGVTRETRVGICVERSADVVVAMIGVLKAGGAYVPLDPAAPIARTRQIDADANLALVLTHDVLAGIEPLAGGADGTCEQKLDPEPEQLAYVIYTSGSTGAPKGVMVTHRALTNLAYALQELYDGREIERVAWNAPFTFDAGVKQWVQLAFGRTVHILDERTRTDPSALCAYIETQRIECLDCTPGYLSVLLEAGLPPMKLLLVGGEDIAPELWRCLAERRDAVNVYGPTECTVDASWLRIQAEAQTATPSIGSPIANVRAFVVERSHDFAVLAAVGVPGELCIAGTGLARGYLNDPALTADRFRPDPFGPPGSRLYRTGDRVRWHANGRLQYLGRLDSQIKIRGFRIEPGEIEHALERHPAVARCAAIADASTQHVVAFVTLQQPSTPAALLDDLRLELPSYLVPDALDVLDSLPLTRHGKIDRHALQRAASERVFASRDAREHTGATTALEELIHNLWAAVLEHEDFGVTDDFFARGGNSLLATRLVLRIRQALGIDVELRTVFAHPTVRALARELERRRRDEERLPPLPPIVAAADESDAPLSFAQQRLWFLGQLVKGNPYYNVPLAVRLRGHLDREALEWALSEVVRRHDALRTVFVETPAGEPRQRVLPPTAVTLASVDLSKRGLDAAEAADGFDQPGRLDLGEEERGREVERLAIAAAREPFDLQRGPLWRATLLRLAADEHLILLTLHHIICDGWSMGILVREVGALYDAARQQRPSPLPPLSLQYADYARWQRAWLQGDALDAQIQYWRTQLAGAPPELSLPTDRPRPAMQSFRGGRLTRVWPAALANALRTLSRQEGVTLFMTLLAGFQVLLARYSGMTDICVGSPIANRTRMEVEGLIGFFVNTLVLRTDLSGDPSFRALLRRVRQVALGAYAHQDVPFERLVDELQPARVLSRNPLFQVDFALQNAPRPPLRLGDITLEPIEIDNKTTKFDLTLSVTELPQGLAATLEYSVDLFDESTVTRMLDQLETLFESAVRDANVPISALAMSSGAERRRLHELASGGALATSADAAAHLRISRWASERPNAIAVVCGDEHLTFADLDREANRLAHYLRRVGITCESRVALHLERTPDMVVTLLAVLEAGGAYVPLDPAHPDDRVRQIIEHSGADLLIVDSAAEATRLAPRACRVLCLDEHRAEIAAMPHGAPAEPIEPEQLAYIIYTSGSTGRPKGVMVTHGGLANYLAWSASAYDVLNGAGAPVQSPLTFDLTVTSVLTPLAAGQCVVLLPDEHDLRSLRDARGMSLIKITPAHLQLLAGVMPPESVAGWTRSLVVGGEALTAASLRFFREHAPAVRVFNEYGPTETVVGCCVYELPAGEPIPEHVPIGTPIANTLLRVLTPTCELMPMGARGELYIGGAGVARGYVGQPDLTAERFVPDPFSDVPGARLYKTGDIIRYRGDGNLEYLGRTDDQVKIRGYRIEPGEIEAVLREHPGVGEARVIVDDDPQAGKTLVACVVPREEFRSSTIEADRVARWQSIFDTTVQSHATHSAAEPRDPSFNIAGWTSSYTGLPIPPDEMREWVDRTVARILELRPRRVLEIGSGTGLLLFRIAPHCERYVATDFSAEALDYARSVAAARSPAFDHVEFAQVAAHDATGAIDGPIDCIILNSVVQYFPSAEYLRDVLESAVARLAPGGHVFIGDVRNLADLETLHTSLAQFRARPGEAAADIRRRVLQAMQDEEELVLAPDFFFALARGLSRVDGVLCRAKLGRAVNELTKFRYDAILHVSSGERARAIEVLTAIEDDRTRAEREAWMDRADAAERAGRVLDPCLLPGEAGQLRLHQRDRREPPAFFEPTRAAGHWRDYANRPSLTRVHRHLPAVLRDALATRLPSYMLPARIAIVDRMPLTRNGKLDVAAIAALARMPERAARATHDAVQPMTESEQLIASIWADLLGEQAIGRDDEFFMIGGHSLLATQLVARIRTVFDIELNLRHVFEAPRLRDLAGRVDRLRLEDAGQRWPAIHPADRREPLPLAYAQERLWMLQQLNPHSTDFNVPIALHLEGEVSPVLLADALQHLIERHETLRTVFTENEAGVSQVVLPRHSIAVEQLTSASMQEAIELATVRAREAFDLVHGPLLRVVLIRIADREHLLAITLHHLISDTWSLGVLIRELVSLYEARVRGVEAALPPIAIHYADYAAWQHRVMTPEALEPALGYWRTRLAALPPLMLRPRAAEVTLPAKSTERFALNAELMDTLAAFCRTEQASVFMVLLAAFQVVLHEHAGTGDILLATNVANRSRPETQLLIGFLANQVVLRGDLSGNPTFRSVIGQARQRTLEAYAHEWAPFHLVQRETRPARHGAASVLTQIKFNYHEMTRAPKVRDLRVTPITIAFERTREEALLWQMIRTGTTLHIEAEADARYLTAAALASLIRHFTLVLEQGIAHPDRPIAAFTDLVRAEKDQLRAADRHDKRQRLAATLMDAVRS